MTHTRLYNYLLLLAFTLLLVGSGCSKADESITEQVGSGAISVSIRDASGTVTRLADGLTLGLTTDNMDEGEYATVNRPYLLKDGLLIPNSTPITVPDGSTYARLCVYGPYSDGENFILGPYPNRPPFYTVNLNFGVELDQRTLGTASSDLVWGELAEFKGVGFANNVVMTHKYCKIKIKLTSELGNDISDAKVTLMGVFTGGQLKFEKGTFVVSNAMRQEVTAYHKEDGSYEVIIPAQVLQINEPLIRIEVGGTTYTFRNAADKKLLEGAEYLFDVTVKDSGELPFTIAVTYDNGKPLGDRLAVEARETTYSITMKEIPNPGNKISFVYVRIRNASGAPSWVRLGNTHSLTPDVLYDGVLYSYLLFEENLSPEPRSMTLEFYNDKDPKFVHKRVLIEQAGASNYLTLSTSALATDKWGNMYDFPQVLRVQSNRGWTMENGVPDWVVVEGYTAGNRNQELRITVKENTTGVERKGELRFVIAGKTEKIYSITQTAAENATFTLKYDLNLYFNTTNNWFRKDFGDLGELYAGHITVFAKFEPNPDTAAEINTESQYGYVTDAPSSANNLVVTDFSSKYFVYPNYNGQAKTLSDVNSSILSSEANTRQTFFRQIMFSLPIPANVKRNQKVKYTVTINNIKGTASHDKATVNYAITNQ